MIVVLMRVTGSGISSPSRTRMSRKRETRCSSTSSPPMPARPTRPPACGGRSRTNSWTSSLTRRSTRFEPSWSTRFSWSVDSSLSSSAPRNHPLKSYCRPEISPRCKPTWTSPLFTCPRYGKDYLVPLASCEAFLDGTPIQTRDGAESVYVLSCQECEVPLSWEVERFLPSIFKRGG